MEEIQKKPLKKYYQEEKEIKHLRRGNKKKTKKNHDLIKGTDRSSVKTTVFRVSLSHRDLNRH